MLSSLESGTVEAHRSEGGIGDVAAAGHTQDLQLVASSAQADQAFVCYLLEATDGRDKLQKHTEAHTHTLMCFYLTTLQPNAALTVQDCMLMVVSSGQCF